MAQVIVLREQLDDWYVDGTESAVLVGDQVMVLSELATMVVELVGDSGIPLPDLAVALASRFGSPEASTPLTATAAVVHELSQSGIVRTEVS
jgi:hypothetical protein